MHERKTCTCHDLKPLHIFVSGVGGTGKSFLIKTICALVSNILDDLNDATLCAVTAQMGLAAFNMGGITMHRLLQLTKANQPGRGGDANITPPVDHRRSVHGGLEGVHSPPP